MAEWCSEKRDDTQPKSVQISRPKYHLDIVFTTSSPSLSPEPYENDAMAHSNSLYTTVLYLRWVRCALNAHHFMCMCAVCASKEDRIQLSGFFSLFSHRLPFKFISLAEMEAGLCVSFRKSSFSAIFNAIGMHSTKSYSVALLRFVSHTLCVVRRFYSLEFVFFCSALFFPHFFCWVWIY